MSRIYFQMYKNSKSLRYLGIDPGTSRIGFGLIEVSGNSLRCLKYGIIKNLAIKESVLNFRNTVQKLEKLVKKYSPDTAAVEKLFFFKNQKTIIPVSEMRGVIIHTLSRHGISIAEFTPLEVKQVVCNYGRADKQQVQQMVRMFLKLPKPVKPDDAADALALAITCATTHRSA